MMTLEQAMSYAIQNEGIGIISEPRLFNYLNDLQALTEPAIKRIVSTMINEGYLAKLQPYLNIENDSYQTLFMDVKSRLVTNEGFQENLVNFVLDSLLFAVHKIGNVPVPPITSTERIETSKKAKTLVKSDFGVIEVNGNYLVSLNGLSYELNESQYKAILRKKDMPADRLALWLKSYSEEK
jgi:hypothetical protein